MFIKKFNILLVNYILLNNHTKIKVKILRTILINKKMYKF